MAGASSSLLEARSQGKKTAGTTEVTRRALSSMGSRFQALGSFSESSRPIAKEARLENGVFKGKGKAHQTSNVFKKNFGKVTAMGSANIMSIEAELGPGRSYTEI